ncbi:MAG: MoxR family ATPase [Pseudomonadota bacterium]
MSAALATEPPPAIAEAVSMLRKLEGSIARVIRGKPEAIKLAITALLGRGHLLIEDVPGVGKTTLAVALARSIGGAFRRIQFTSDLLPSDILGVSVFSQQSGRFELQQGPIFANVVLADEINRTTPRTQSSLLEAMAEGQVSIDNVTHVLERPFLVIATQNPQEHYGTYPLPESQMDRFLLRIRLGYPRPDDERRIVRDRNIRDPVAAVEPVLTLPLVCRLQELVGAVRVDEALLDYALQVAEQSRSSVYLSLGVSPRGLLAWYRAAQSYALLTGRDYCVPDDFKELAIPALAHRLILASQQETLGRAREEAERVIAEILDRVPVP